MTIYFIDLPREIVVRQLRIQLMALLQGSNVLLRTPCDVATRNWKSNQLSMTLQFMHNCSTSQVSNEIGLNGSNCGTKTKGL